MKAFVSHSTVDKEFVENHIVDFLEQNGVATWYSSDNIDSATEWEKKTRQALNECDWFLVVLTPNSVASPWVQAEVHWAMDHRRDQVVPVLAESCAWQDLHLMLRTRQLVFLNENLEEGKSKLLAIWEKQLRPVVHQKIHNSVLCEPVLAIVESCVSTVDYDYVAVGATRAVSLRERREAALPEFFSMTDNPELASVQSDSSAEYLFSSGEFFRLQFHFNNSSGLNCSSGAGVKYELPALASCTCEVSRSLDRREGSDRLIGCANGALCAFEPGKTNDPIRLISHHSQLTTLATSTRSVLASGDVDGCVNIWDQSRLQKQGSVELHAPVYLVTVNSHRSQFIASVGNGEICTFDYYGNVSTRLKVANRPVTQLLSISETLVVFSTRETLGLLDLKQQKVMGNYKLNSKTSSALIRKESRLHNSIIVGCDDGSLVELDIHNPRSPRTRTSLMSI